MSDIQEKIAQERQNAREVCGVDGSSGACAAAWDAVEELQAEAAHQRTKSAQGQKTTLQQYCDDNPDAAECRLYED
jgi:hypothetical protein